MSTREGYVPTRTEFEAYSLGKLEPQRAGAVESYLADHPESWAILEAAPDDGVLRHLRGAGELPLADGRCLLLTLAIEAVIPVLGGCAGALAAEPAGGLLGVAVGQAIEKAINFFGQRVVGRWLEWLRRQPAASGMAALADLAELPPEEARRQVTAALDQQVPQANSADRQAAIDYLSAIPRSLQRSLPSDAATGGRALPPTVSWDHPLSLLQLLPADVPPYPAPAALPGTDYRLEELIGSGGFGAVYRASSPSLQYLPLEIKFCLDRTLLPALEQERTNLERLMKAGGESWSPRLVRLYGYSLEHRTPYLVYEYVAGGDLVHWLAVRRASTGRGLTAAEVLELIVQVAEALAFAHQRGLVHRDLKPANVLMGDGASKLADFGIGGLMARQAVQGSRIGTRAASLLSPAEQASLFRGAGTPLYMAPEQRGGAPPDPRHDLYSLGVMWYQLLVGDVSREMLHGWARELAVRFATPRQQIELIERCVGWIEERPKDAVELLQLLRPLLDEQAKATTAEPAAVRPLPAAETMPPTAPPPLDTASPEQRPPSAPEDERSQEFRFRTRLRQLRQCHVTVAWWRNDIFWLIVLASPLLGVVLGSWVGLAVYIGVDKLFKPPQVSHPSWNLDTRFRDRLEGGETVPSHPSWNLDTLSKGIGITCGLIVLGACIWLGVKLLRRGQKRVAAALAAKVEELLTEFPEECQTWGGRAALADGESLQEIIRNLAARSTMESEGSRWLRFLALMRQLEKCHEAVLHAGCGPVCVSVLLGLPGAALVYNNNFSNLGPMLTGVFLLAGAVLLGIRQYPKARPRAEAALAAKVEELLTEFPEECQTWGGRAALTDRDILKAVLRRMEAPRR